MTTAKQHASSQIDMKEDHVLIVPILNEPLTLPEAPAWYLNADVRIDSPSVIHRGLFTHASAEVAGKASSITKCIVKKLPKAPASQEEVDVFCTIVSFALSYLSPKVLTLPVALYVEKHYDSSARLAREFVITGSDWGTLNSLGEFSYTDKPESASELFTLISRACSVDRKLPFSLDRYLSSQIRKIKHDQVIDLTIALESLVQDGKEELSFKFALYNAFAAESDPAKRLETFRNLRLLYNARSTFVHGDSTQATKELQKALTHWNELVETSKKAIMYRILFLQSEEPKNWAPHLQKMILSNAPRVTTEMVEPS